MNQCIVVAVLFLGGLWAQEAPKPLYRDPVFDGAADPLVVRAPGGKKLVMFYTSRRANVEGLKGVTWVHGTPIGRAESTDGGVTWKFAGNAKIPYGTPDYTYWAPEVFPYKGTYHMYLSVVPGIFPDWNAPREIVHLTSKNLTKWKLIGKVELGSDRVIDATVFQLPNGSFRMWYKNERARDGSIYYADSPDLNRWTVRGTAIPGGRGEGAKVFRWKGRYWLLVDIWDGIAVYSSDDCEHWTRQAGGTLLKEPGTHETERAKGNHVDVVLDRNRAYLFYFVHQDRKRSVIQVAELGVADGILTCDRNAPARIALETRK